MSPPNYFRVNDFIYDSDVRQWVQEVTSPDALAPALRAMAEGEARIAQFVTTTSFGRHFGIMDWLGSREGFNPRHVAAFGLGRTASELRELALLFRGATVTGFDGSLAVLEQAHHPVPVDFITPLNVLFAGYESYLERLGIGPDELKRHNFRYGVGRDVTRRIDSRFLRFGLDPVPTPSGSYGVITCFNVLEHLVRQAKDNLILAKIFSLELANALEMGGWLVFDGLACHVLPAPVAKEFGLERATLFFPSLDNNASYVSYHKTHHSCLDEVVQLARAALVEGARLVGGLSTPAHQPPLTSDDILSRLKSDGHVSLFLTNHADYTLSNTEEPMGFIRIGVAGATPFNQEYIYQIRLGDVVVGILALTIDKKNIHASVNLSELSQGIEEVTHRVYWHLSRLLAREASLWGRDLQWHFRSPTEHETFSGSLALMDQEIFFDPLEYIVTGKSFRPFISFPGDPDWNELARLKNRWAVEVEGAGAPTMYGVYQVVNQVPDYLLTTDRNAAIARVDSPLAINLYYGKPTTRVISWMHGDEPSGFQAMLNYFADPLNDPPTNLLFLIHNPKSAKAGPTPFTHRVVPGQLDPNRLWYRATDRQTPHAFHVRQVMEIFKTTGKLEAMIDLHNTITDPPFSVLTGERHSLHYESSRMLAEVLTGETPRESPHVLSTIEAGLKPLMPGVTIECGPRGSAEADQFATKVLRHFVSVPVGFLNGHGASHHHARHANHTSPHAVTTPVVTEANTAAEMSVEEIIVEG